VDARRVLLWSAAAFLSLAFGDALGRERDRFYLLACGSPFLACFLVSLGVMLARRKAKAPDLPASVIEAARARFNIPGHGPAP
jgi:hypothetical protein